MKNKEIQFKKLDKMYAAKIADFAGRRQAFLKLSPSQVNSAKNYTVKRYLAAHPDDEFLIGIELEFECSSAAMHRDALAIVNKHLPNHARCVRDGSLGDYGIEINTLPLSLPEYKQLKLPIYNMCRDLQARGCTSHDSERCGLHVHVNRKFMDTDKWKAVESFVLRNKAMFMKLSRRTENGVRWCKFLKWNGDRYRAVNFTDNTIEYRFYRGTIKAVTLLSSIDSLILLTKYGKQCKKNLTLKGFRRYLSKDSSPEKFGKLMFESTFPEYILPLKPYVPLTPEQRAERLILRAHKRKAKEDALVLEMQNMVATYSTFRASSVAYSEMGTTVKPVVIEVPVIFKGRCKKAIKERQITKKITVFAKDTDSLPTTLTMYTSRGWGSQRRTAYANSGSTSYTTMRGY